MKFLWLIPFLFLNAALAQLSPLSQSNYFFAGNGNYVQFVAPNAVSSSYTLVLPSAQGGATTCLVNDGAGNLSWTSCSGGGGGVTSVNTRTGAVVLTSADVGLSNVNNTSDANKPVSTAQQTALNLKANIASPIFTGVAEFANGSVANPSIAFSNDASIGFKTGGSGDVEVVSTNQTIAQFDTNGLTMPNAKPILFQGTNFNTINISAPTTISSTYNIKLPAAQGAANTFPQNDGSGNLSWQTITPTSIGAVTAIIGVDAVDTVGVTLSGIQTVDGFVTGNGNRILEAIPTAGVDDGNTVNGCYVTSTSGAWTRCTDMASASQFYRGMKVYAHASPGNGVHDGTTWVLRTAPPFTLGTTRLDFENENLSTNPNQADWHLTTSPYSFDVNTNGFNFFVHLSNPFGSNKNTTLQINARSGGDQIINFPTENAASITIPSLKSPGAFKNKTVNDVDIVSSDSLINKRYADKFNNWITYPETADPGLDDTTDGAIFYVNTTGGPVSFQLIDPAFIPGYRFYVKDYANTFAANNFTLKKFSTSKTEYVNADYVINTNGAYLMVYSDGVQWFVTQVVESRTTLASATAGQLAYYSGANAVGGNANATISGGQLNLGPAGSPGGLGLYNSSLNFVVVQPSASIPQNYNFNLPDGPGLYGQVLTTDHFNFFTTNAFWAYPAVSTPFTSNITIAETSATKTLLVDTSGGAFNVNLMNPATATNGFHFFIKDVGNTLSTNNLTLVRFGSEKIEVIASNYALTTNKGFWKVFTNGTDWFLSAP